MGLNLFMVLANKVRRLQLIGKTNLRLICIPVFQMQVRMLDW
tara:strand:- start:215 stop:340 length:126 start_codon:yes stop_codon:yes gene_type:complete